MYVFNIVFFFVTKIVGRGDGAVVQSRKDLRAQRTLTKVFTFTSSKGTSGARTQDLSDSRLVFLSLDQAFGVIFQHSI